MASSSFVVVVFLLIITVSSPLFLLQIHARDSQFFSKVTNTPTETVVLPDKEQEQKSIVNKQETEQPEFVPQNQNGYGLYGQENTETKSGVQTLTPGTYAGAQTETEQFGNSNGETFYNNGEKYYSNNKYQNDDAFFNNGEKYYSNNKYQNDDPLYNNGEKYYSNKDQNDDDLLDFDDSFDAKTQNSNFYYNNNNGVGTEHYTQKDNTGENYYYNTDKKTDRSSQFGTQLRGQTETNYNDNGFTNKLNTRYNEYRTATQNQNRGSNVERQGMSDTRFLEKGRYYYDVNKEQNQYANKNAYKANYDSNEFGNRAYRSNEVDGVNGNYENNFYDNSGGEKYEFNTMEEYERSRQNQYDP
ncbi:hypothetical protein QQ045_010675 [Rhodiola kirilowii]